LRRFDERPAKSQLRQERQRLNRLRQSSVFARNQSATRSIEALRFTAQLRRKRIFWASLIAPLVALMLLVLATLVTPLLSIDKIVVQGTHRLKPVSIQNALESQLGSPLTLVSAEGIAKSLQTFSLIESISVIAQPPHTLVVRVREREPICIVEISGQRFLFDPAGVQIGVASNDDRLPLVQIYGNPKTSSQFSRAMDVVLALPVSLLPKVESIQAKTKDDVRLRLRGASHQQIIWGDGSKGALKSKVLAAMLRHLRGDGALTVDVSSPTAPVVRYGNY